MPTLPAQPPPPHTHRWMQCAKDVVSEVNGLVTTRYEHECPVCFKHKVTVRANRSLPPEVKWHRELEKLMQRIWADGYCYDYDDAALVLNRIEVKKHT